MKTSLLPLRQVRVTDPFWQRETQLVRDAVIPYQWEALNDRVAGAAPSWWMHNMRAAARAVAAKKAGGTWKPVPAPKGMLSEPAAAPEENAFYGWVFQDSDGYKWIEAVAYQLILRPDEQLQALAQQAVDAICAAQEEDGYLDTYYTLTGREKAFSNLRDNHELYCFGHLAEAAVAWHQATGRDDLLNAAVRFADCIGRKFGPGLERGCPGHEIAEMALVRLYLETGEERFLRQAEFFLDVRGTEPSTFALEENRRRAEEGLPPLEVTAKRYRYHQADRPVREIKEAVGHAVRQLYLASGMADVARLTGDEAMWAACRRLWRSVTGEKMYVTGGVGGTHVGEAFSYPYDLPSDTAYSETCAAIALVFFARRMLEAETNAEYAGVMEQALYNTVLAGIALDGKSFFYVNPLEVNPEAVHVDERLRHVKTVRQKWFGCACCPPNVARLLSDLGQYIFTVSESNAYVHLYIGCEAQLCLNGSALKVKLDAEVPRREEITLTVTEGSAEGGIGFRLPDWAENISFTVNGASVRAEEENGYAVIRRAWQAGDTVCMHFDAPLRALAVNPLSRETAEQICFAWGPYILCAEEADNGKNLQLIRVSPKAKARLTEENVCGVPVPAASLEAFRLCPEGTPLYRRAEESVPCENTTLKLVPYFAWNNRGEGEMRVWLHPIPEVK